MRGASESVILDAVSLNPLAKLGIIKALHVWQSLLIPNASPRIAVSTGLQKNSVASDNRQTTEFSVSTIPVVRWFVAVRL